MMLGPERYMTDPPPPDTRVADDARRDRTGKRWDLMAADVEDKRRTINELLHGDRKAALADLRGGREPQGRAYLVTDDFVPPIGRVRRGWVIEIAGRVAGMERYVMALEDENGFDDGLSAIEILFR